MWFWSSWVPSALTYRRQQFAGQRHLLATDGDGSPVGTLVAWWDKSVEHPIGFVVPAIPDAHFSPELADAIWAVARAELSEQGCRSIQCWLPRPAPSDPDAARWITPVIGTGSVPGDAWAQWLSGAGFTLQQASQSQMLRVCDGIEPARATLELLRPGYAVRTWHGAIPEELLQPMILIQNRMPIDAPNANFDPRDGGLTAKRLRTYEEAVMERGQSIVTTAIHHVASGDLVGYTELHVGTEGVAAVQQDTLVHGEHRGKGLGLTLKSTNLVAMLEQHREVERIHTWNAAENRHMLAINAALGFREVGVEAGWQWRQPQE